MYSYKYFLENFDYLIDRLSLRGVPKHTLEDIRDMILDLKKMNELIMNNVSEKSNLEKNVGENREAIRKKKEDIGKLKTSYEKLDSDLFDLISTLPNVPHSSLVSDSVVIREWGEKRIFDWDCLDHKVLGEKNDLFSLEDGALISGSGYVVYKDFGANLYRVLQRFTLDVNKRRGYSERWLPIVVSRDSLFGTGQLPKFQNDLFSLSNEKYLSPTSESQLVNLYRGKILNSKHFPIKLTANTNCFRKEDGGAGSETKGIIRMHQFNKTEIVTFCFENESFDILEDMVKDACSILEELKLPYRILQLSYDDISFSSAKTYDIEVWFPSENRYREISSVSNTLDFQSRRAKIRYKHDVFDKSEKSRYPHILNGSALAIDRLFAAILENYQNRDGEIEIPDKLKCYF